MGGEEGGGSGWGTRVYLWRIHVDIWQNQYNIVKLKNKIKLKKIMNNAINEIKNTLEATNIRITEAEDRISELEDRMVEIKES